MPPPSSVTTWRACTSVDNPSLWTGREVHYHQSIPAEHAHFTTINQLSPPPFYFIQSSLVCALCSLHFYYFWSHPLKKFSRPFPIPFSCPFFLAFLLHSLFTAVFITLLWLHCLCFHRWGPLYSGQNVCFQISWTIHRLVHKLIYQTCTHRLIPRQSARSLWREAQYTKQVHVQTLLTIE